MESHAAIPLYSLCEDILLMICDQLSLTRSGAETPMSNLSLASHHLRHMLVPHLFKNIYINRPLSQLIPTSLVYHYAQTLHVDMFGSKWWWCSGAYVCSDDAMALFQLIQKLSHLHTLNMTMMSRNHDMFDQAFASSPTDTSPFALPHITSLTFTSAAAFLAAHCPNARSLTIQDAPSCSLEPYTDIPSRLAPRHPHLLPAPTPNPPPHTPHRHLTHLDTTASWTHAELAALTPLFPSLTHLHMRTEALCYRTPVPLIATTLSTLPRLRVLRVLRIGCLDMGYRAVWTRCVQACADARQRRALWARDEAARVEAENAVVRVVFAACKGVRVCWVGEGRVARRGEGGGGWVWERRGDGDGGEKREKGERAEGYGREREAVVLKREVCF